MNLKIAHLVAIQFGIFVGTMSWLIYSRLPSAGPPVAAEVAGRMVNSVRPEAPVSERRSPSPRVAGYDAGREQAEQVDEQTPQWMQVYYQSISPQRYAKSAVLTGPLAVNSPSYANVYQEQAAVSTDSFESPQTVVYSQPVFYAESGLIGGFSNSRRFANRCGPAPEFGPPLTIPNQRPGTPQFGQPPLTIPNQRPGRPQFGQPPLTIPNQPPVRRNSHVNNTRIVSGHNVRAPSRQPAGGGRPRGHR